MEEPESIWFRRRMSWHRFWSLPVVSSDFSNLSDLGDPLLAVLRSLISEGAGSLADAIQGQI